MRLEPRTVRLCRKLQEQGQYRRIIGAIMYDTGCEHHRAVDHYLRHYRIPIRLADAEALKARNRARLWRLAGDVVSALALVLLYLVALAAAWVSNS